MTPAERSNLEYTYQNLAALMERGDIRQAEMDELYRIDDILRPIWTQEQADYEQQMADTPKGYQFGDVGARAGNETLSAAGDVLANAGNVTRAALPESMQPYLSPAWGRIPDVGLAGLLSLVGGVEKGVGYGAEVVDAGARGLMDMLGMTPRYAPGTGAEVLAGDILGGLEVTGVGPEARALGALGRAATTAARGKIASTAKNFIGDERGSVPIPGFRPPSDVSGPDAKTFGTGWQDVYHWSRSPEDFTEFDLSKSTGSTSRLGPHVGTPGAASDRFMGWDEPRGFTMPLKANLSAPFTNPSTGEPWTELDLEMFISALADEHGIDRRDVPPFMRQKLAGQGFTSIPYINDVEDPGSISHIMLTDRPVGSDAVMRSRFARFDPRNSTNKNLSAGLAGVGAPIGLLAMQPNEEQY